MDSGGLPVSIAIIIFGIILGLFIFAGLLVSAIVTGAL
jgi:hypothetical protein